MTWTRHSEVAEQEECFPLTVTSFNRHASYDAVYDEDADDMTAIILNETFEMLDFLLDRVPYVLVTLGLHVDIWGVAAYPENIQIHETWFSGYSSFIWPYSSHPDYRGSRTWHFNFLL